MVDSQWVPNRSMKFMNADTIHDGVVTDVVCFPARVTCLESASGQQECEGVAIVITTVAVL